LFGHQKTVRLVARDDRRAEIRKARQARHRRLQHRLALTRERQQLLREQLAR
jgi:hypothetical protein